MKIFSIEFSRKFLCSLTEKTSVADLEKHVTYALIIKAAHQNQALTLAKCLIQFSKYARSPQSPDSTWGTGGVFGTCSAGTHGAARAQQPEEAGCLCRDRACGPIAQTALFYSRLTSFYSLY
jgi:hypothetical protein